MREERLLIASCGAAENPHGHLDPIVAAELGWGNRVLSDWRQEGKFGMDGWRLRLAKPFHVELLRATFRFSADVKLWAVGPCPGGDSMSLSAPDFVGIRSPLPKDHGLTYREIRQIPL